jgi:hypothetical protein
MLVAERPIRAAISATDSGRRSVNRPISSSRSGDPRALRWSSPVTWWRFLTLMFKNMTFFDSEVNSFLKILPPRRLGTVAMTMWSLRDNPIETIRT